MKRILLALTAATALALTGCSGTSADGGEGSTAGSSDSAETQVESTPLSQEEWIELCAPDGGANPDDPKCIEDLGEGDEEGFSDEDYYEQQGEWFVFTTTDNEDMIEKWDVRIDSAELTDLLPEAKYNEEWDGGDDIPQYIDAKPADGNVFLHAEYSVKNTNKEPLYLALEPAVLFTDGEMFAPLGEDANDYAPNLNQRHDNPAGDQQNPGTETQGDFVIEIPKGSEIEALILTDMFIGSGAEATVVLDVAS